MLGCKMRFVRCDRQPEGFLIGKSHRLVETGRRPTPPVRFLFSVIARLCKVPQCKAHGLSTGYRILPLPPRSPISLSLSAPSKSQISIGSMLERHGGSRR